MGATLSTLLRAVHPGTIAMTDFRQRLRPKVLTRHLGDLGILHVISFSDEDEEAKITKMGMGMGKLELDISYKILSTLSRSARAPRRGLCG